MSDSYSVVVKIQGQNQLSTPVQQATQSLRGLNQEATKTGNAFSQLQTLGAGLFAGVTIAGVTRMAEQLYSSGMEAQRAETLFKSFGAQLGDTGRVMDDLRKATRGVVDDVSLMEGASRLLSMGIAKNADDVTHLTSIAATFAQAMGTDVAGALEQVSLIISNESYLRLDSLGIGSAQVKELANQYKAAGMESSAAFAQAFMDVADQKMPQMSAVADATVTSLQQLQTSVDNWWVDFGNRFADGVNGMIGLAGILAQKLGEVWAAGAPTTPPMTVGGGTANVPGGPITIPNMNVSGDMIIAQDGYSAADAATNAAMQAQIAAYYGGAAGRGIAPNYLDLLGGRGSAAGDFASAQAMNDRTALIAANVATAAALSAAGLSGVGSGNSRFSGLSDVFTGMLNRDYGRVGSFGGQTIYSAEGVANLDAAADRMERIADDAKAMDNAFTDMQLESLQQAATYMRGVANDAQSARDALANASLSQLFGQTSGGRLGEIDAAILAQMQAEGADSSTLDAMRTALGLDSGQLTQMSVQFEQDVIPQLAAIGAQYGTDAVIAARTAYEAAVQQAALSGQTGPLNLPAVLGYQQYPGTGGPGGSYTIKPGDTLSGIAAQYNMTTAQLASLNGISNPGMIVAGRSLNLGGGGALVNTNFDPLEQSMMAGDSLAMGVQSQFEQGIQGAMDSLENVVVPTVKVPVELVVQNVGGFLGMVGDAIATVVNGNGGTTPGSSANGGRSNAGTRNYNSINTTNSLSGIG